MAPMVSAIIPTQNRPEMLREAAASVLNQTFQNLELIIVLNAATQTAIAAAREIGEAPNVRLIYLPRGGLAAARNEGIRQAAGELVAFLDDDDLWLPTKIERQVEVIKQTGADMVNCDFIESGEESDGSIRSIRPPPGFSIAEAFMLQNYGAGSASGAIVRKTAALSIGGFDERLSACEDWDFWRRLSWDHKIVFLDEALITIRRHKAGMSRHQVSMMIQEVRLLIKITRDSPPHLRHMVGRAWRTRCASILYSLSNVLTRGRVRRVYRRWLKPAAR